MVCFGAVGFAFPVVVVLEFYPACRAVCDAHGLGPCEYLFSELLVFAGACSAHRVSSSLFSSLLLLVLGGGASQRQRDERLHRPNTTLLFSFFFVRLSFSFAFLLSLLFFVLGWRVRCSARAAPASTHVTPHAPCCVPGLSI